MMREGKDSRVALESLHNAFGFVSFRLGVCGPVDAVGSLQPKMIRI